MSARDDAVRAVLADVLVVSDVDSGKLSDAHERTTCGSRRDADRPGKRRWALRGLETRASLPVICQAARALVSGALEDWQTRALRELGVKSGEYNDATAFQRELLLARWLCLMATDPLQRTGFEQGAHGHGGATRNNPPPVRKHERGHPMSAGTGTTRVVTIRPLNVDAGHVEVLAQVDPEYSGTGTARSWRWPWRRCCS